jgi:hypothetical protein
VSLSAVTPREAAALLPEARAARVSMTDRLLGLDGLPRDLVVDVELDCRM